MAFTLDPQTEKITFGVVSDATHDGIALALADRFGVSENFKDDFSTYVNQTEADAAWLPQDTPDNQVDIVNDNYFFTVKRDGTNFSTSLDLLALTGARASDTEWVLRCKVTIGTPYTKTTVLSAGLNISLSNTDSSIGFGAQDDEISMGLINTIVGGGAQHSVNWIDGGFGTSSSTGTTLGWVAGETIYLELKRESSTLIRSTIYTDADYTIVRDTITKPIGVLDVVNGLRYIKLGSASDVTGWDGVFTGTVDDIQFWNNTIFPTLNNNWRLRFKLDLTNLDDGGNAVDKRLYMLMSDEDEISDSDNSQDSLGVLLRHDNAISNFSILDTNAITPSSATSESTFTTAPSVSTFFVEIRRTTNTTYQASLYPDNTFGTPTETESGFLDNTTGLRYIKFMNDVTFTGAGAIDGTIDDIGFTNLATAEEQEKEIFTVDALLKKEGQTEDFTVDGLNSLMPMKMFLLDVLLKGGCFSNIFSDDFATNTNWTQVGTGVSVTGGEIQGWGADGSDRRVHHDLVTPLNDNGWKAEFECEFSFFSTGFFSPNHELFQATDTQAPETTDKDLIGVKFGQSNNLNNFGIYVDDHTPSTLPIVVNPTIASTGVRYFVRLERLSLTQVKMSIFTGGFDVTPFGTPVSATIPSTITGLRFIQSSNNNNGSTSRVLTGVLDNLVLAGQCPSFTIDACIQEGFITEDFIVDGLVDRHASFSIDVSITGDTGLVRDVGDLIRRVLLENPPSLTGNEIVDEIIKITTVELQWGFRGKVSRIKNWISFLEKEGVIVEDNSDPDWHETNWSLV